MTGPSDVGFQGDDPRLDPDYLRTVSGDDGQVVLVGVVHDHPASVHRARAVVEQVAPDVVALELPSLAVPLFRRYAEDRQTPPAEGGEMSAAVQAADDARVVGIDAPSLAYARRLAAKLWAERPSAGTVRDVLAETAAVARHAARCRLAASPWPSVDSGFDGRVDHDASVADPPDRQASHEATHLARSRSLLGAVERPASMRLTDGAREEAMADELASLDGDVVAIVGFDHLDDVAGHLDGR